MSGTQWAIQGYKYAHVAANGTVTLITSLMQPNGTAANPAGSLGIFAGASLNSPGSAWTVVIWDGPSGTGTMSGSPM